MLSLATAPAQIALLTTDMSVVRLEAPRANSAETGRGRMRAQTLAKTATRGPTAQVARISAPSAFLECTRNLRADRPASIASQEKFLTSVLIPVARTANSAWRAGMLDSGRRLVTFVRLGSGLERILPIAQPRGLESVQPRIRSPKSGERVSRRSYG